MKAITFTEKQIEFLREQYQDELAQAKEYVNQIIGLLNKLGVREKSVKEEPVEIKVYKKHGPKPKVKVVEPKAEPKKRGRKPKVALPTLEIVSEHKPEKKEGKKKVSKSKVGKKTVTKAAPKKKSTEEVIAAPVKEVKVDTKKDVKKKVAKKQPVKKSPVKIETAPVKDVKDAPKKKMKKVVKKKSIEKRRIEEMAKSAKLTKPVSKEEPITETVTPAPEL